MFKKKKYWIVVYGMGISLWAQALDFDEEERSCNEL